MCISFPCVAFSNRTHVCFGRARNATSRNCIIAHHGQECAQSAFDTDSDTSPSAKPFIGERDFHELLKSDFRHGFPLR